MIEVHQNIYLGTDDYCSSLFSDEWAIIHACKDPCHRKFVGYTSNLKPNHPNYLIYEIDNHLVLNMVDMENELLARFTDPIMKSAMEFIGKNIDSKKIFIHCNQGMSRSPSIALLYLARIGEIKNDSFRNAAIDFQIKYPNYNPGKGIALYMNKNWETIVKFENN